MRLSLKFLSFSFLPIVDESPFHSCGRSLYGPLKTCYTVNILWDKIIGRMTILIIIHKGTFKKSALEPQTKTETVSGRTNMPIRSTLPLLVSDKQTRSMAMGYLDLLDFSYLAGKLKKKSPHSEWYLEYFIPFGVLSIILNNWKGKFLNFIWV